MKKLLYFLILLIGLQFSVYGSSPVVPTEISQVAQDSLPLWRPYGKYKSDSLFLSFLSGNSSRARSANRTAPFALYSDLYAPNSQATFNPYTLNNIHFGGDWSRHTMIWGEDPLIPSYWITMQEYLANPDACDFTIVSRSYTLFSYTDSGDMLVEYVMATNPIPEGAAASLEIGFKRNLSVETRRGQLEVRGAVVYNIYDKSTGQMRQLPVDCVSYMPYNQLGIPPGITPSPEHNILKTVYTQGDLLHDLVQTVSYYDGFGRVCQTVDVGASPLGEDIITPVEYDNLGRVAKEYLPYASSRSGWFRSNATSAQSSFYSSLFPGETRPYRESTYEFSSADRVKSVMNVGRVYADNGKQQSLEYRVVNNQILRLVVQSGSFRVMDYHDALLENRTTNEDGQTSSTYIDGWGRTVATCDAAGAMTYYAHDARGQLTYVISPMGAAELSVGGHYTDSHSMVTKYCYLYKYDVHGRVVEKQLPGAASVYIVYDNSDRITATQDGAQRARNEWTVVVYDAFGRETERWLAVNTSLSPSSGNKTSAEILSQCSSTEKISSYSYDSYPVSALAFKALPGVVEQADVDSRMQGIKSYEWVNGVGRSFYYDYKGRLLQTVESNHAGGTSYYNFKYDFMGNLLTSQELHAFSGNATDTLTTSNSYDHRGRLRSSVTRLGGRGAQSAEAISTYEYNSLGQMAVKRLGGEADVTNYTYNIQGWLTSQASPNFTLGLRYYDPVKSASTSYFGGNITEVEWGHSERTANTYSFSYDALSRLVGANHYVGSSLTNSFTESGLSYDLNGNMLSLGRTVGRGVNNSYSMRYDGNQLSSVNSGATYSYDSNGNTTKSGKNNLQFEYNFLNLLSRVTDGAGKSAVYDWGADGLKRSVRVEGDASAGFSYLGSLVYKPNGASSYAIESVAFPEGRFVKTTSGFEVNYHIKDHLGSVRATMNQNGVLSSQSDYYPFGERWSASGEATTNRYLFSGKEKQTASDLQGMSLLDFGARMYDPEIPRWLTQDPLAEKYYQHSPYIYCANSPVKYIDPNGMDWFFYQKEGESEKAWHWHDGDTYKQDMKDENGKVIGQTVHIGSKAVVVFNGFRNEKLGVKNGKSGYIDGEGAIIAKVKVYGPKGSEDQHTFDGYTMTSDAKKYGPIDDGIYPSFYQEREGPFASHFRLQDPIPVLDGKLNPNPGYGHQVDKFGRGYKTSIYIHRTNNNGAVGLDATTGIVSSGCLLINPLQWLKFQQTLEGVDKFTTQVIRK